MITVQPMLEDLDNQNRANPKKIALMNVGGSRGDIQPLVILGHLLIQKGYHVRMITNPVYENMVRHWGITDFFPITGNPLDIFESEQFKTINLTSSNLKALKVIVDTTSSTWETNRKEVAEGCKGMDAIIFPLFTAVDAFQIAEAYKIPSFGVFSYPVYYTREFTPAYLGFTTTGYQFLNGLFYRMVELLGWWFLKDQVNSFRKYLGIEPLYWRFKPSFVNIPVPTFHMYSSSVLPKPKDWPDYMEVNGWVLPPPTLVTLPGESDPEPNPDPTFKSLMPNRWAVPESLWNFLQSGEPPVYFGYGSMAFLNQNKVVDITAQALKATGLRGIYCSGWSTIDPDLMKRIQEEYSGIISFVNYAPHDWLFPRCKATVHHGGAGTTGASLRAGKPLIICSVIIDQPWWGQHIKERKLGAHIPMTKLELQPLIEALKTATTPEVIENAKKVGEIVSKENGAETIASRIDEMMKTGKGLYIPKPEDY